MRKAKALYNQRQIEYEKARELATKAEQQVDSLSAGNVNKVYRKITLQEHSMLDRMIILKIIQSKM